VRDAAAGCGNVINDVDYGKSDVCRQQ